MRSILSRIAGAGIAGIIAASMIAPATAAVRHKRAAPVQTESSADVIGLPMTQRAPPVPVGMATSAAPTTLPDFDVFLLARAP